MNRPHLQVVHKSIAKLPTEWTPFSRVVDTWPDGAIAYVQDHFYRCLKELHGSLSSMEGEHGLDSDIRWPFPMDIKRIRRTRMTVIRLSQPLQCICGLEPFRPKFTLSDEGLGRALQGPMNIRGQGLDLLTTEVVFK